MPKKCQLLIGRLSVAKNWVLYLLIALISCQSAIAMAHSHQSYQFGSEYTEFEQSHGPIDTKPSSEVDVDSHLPAQDVEHDSGHCHSICHLFLSSIKKEITVIASKQSLPGYLQIYHSNIPAPEFRPPII